MKTPKTPAIIAHFIEELQAPVKDLTNWEKNFLISIGNQFERSRSLSDKQFEILERIYSEKTA